MSSYPFPRLGRGSGRVREVLRELKPGEFVHVPYRDVVEEFNLASQPADYLFGPSKDWREHFQEAFGDTVEMSEDYLSGEIMFRHWIGVKYVQKTIRESLSVTNREDVCNGSPSNEKSTVSYEPAEVPVYVDRRTGREVGIAFG